MKQFLNRNPFEIELTLPLDSGRKSPPNGGNFHIIYYIILPTKGLNYYDLLGQVLLLVGIIPGKC